MYAFYSTENHTPPIPVNLLKAQRGRSPPLQLV